MLRYREVKQLLYDYIAKMHVGEQLPSRIALSKQVDSSRATVDKAISELIEEGILEARFGSGTYVSMRIKGMASDRENWCLIVPDISEAIYANLAKGVEMVARERKTNVILCNSEGNVEKQAEYIERLIVNDVRGFIIVPTVLKNADETSVLYSRLQKAEIPFVFCNREVEGVYAPIVKSNDYFGGYIATRHLLKCGYKNIAFVSEYHYKTSLDRCQGYISALQHKGVPIERKRILMQTEGSMQCCMNQLKELLLSEIPVDALFCFNDSTAIAAMNVVRELGLKVSEDIGIIGYNNNSETDYVTPALTSVEYGASKVGELAAHVLGKMVDGNELSGFPYYLVEPHVVEKQSCTGPAAC